MADKWDELFHSDKVSKRQYLETKKYVFSLIKLLGRLFAAIVG